MTKTQKRLVEWLDLRGIIQRGFLVSHLISHEEDYSCSASSVLKFAWVHFVNALGRNGRRSWNLKQFYI